MLNEDNEIIYIHIYIYIYIYRYINSEYCIACQVLCVESWVNGTSYPKWTVKKCYRVIITLYIRLSIGLAVRVFANEPGDWGSVPGQVIPKTKKNGTWCLLA